MYLSNDFLLFLFFKACTWNVIVVQEMLWFLSLQINYIKFIWTVGINSRLDQLQVSQKYSEQICKRYQLYPVRLSTDILCSSLDSFDFLSSCFVVVVAVFFFFELKIYIMVHFRIFGRVSDFRKQEMRAVYFRKQDCFF